MNISNGVYKSVLVNWSSFTFPVVAGTPISAAGVEANNENAIGIIPQAVTEAPLIPQHYILVSGSVSDIEYEDMSLDAIRAMHSIHFLDMAGGGGGLPPINEKATILVEEQSVTVSDNVGIVPGDYDVSEGDALTVSWDGTDYSCEVYTYDGAVAWGNRRGIGGPDTGEPFWMTIVSGTGVGIMAEDGAHEMGIERRMQDPPDGAFLGVQDGEWKAVPNSGGGGGGGGGAIYLTPDENQALPMTYGEIEAAIESGSVVYLKLTSNWGVGEIETNFYPCDRLYTVPSGFEVSFRYPQGVYSYLAATKDDYPVFDDTPY